MAFWGLVGVGLVGQCCRWVRRRRDPRRAIYQAKRGASTNTHARVRVYNERGGTHQDDLRHAEGVVAQRLVERLFFFLFLFLFLMC